MVGFVRQRGNLERGRLLDISARFLLLLEEPLAKDLIGPLLGMSTWPLLSVRTAKIATGGQTMELFGFPQAQLLSGMLGGLAMRPLPLRESGTVSMV